MPKTQPKQKANSKKFSLLNRGWRFWLKWSFIGGLCSALFGALLIVLVLVYFAGQVPDLGSLEDYQPKQVTKIYARDGALITEYARQRRQYVSYDEIPESIIQAFLASEDSSFFTHSGFDLKAIIRAALTNIFTNRLQGASTITQQVAKTFLLSSERTYTRKIKELILASRIENHFEKEEILTLYLNQIYMGQGAYGIAAAADTYYSKALDELSIGQLALLAGLPKAPSGYNPLRHPKAARLRRDVVLKRMEAEGFITPAQANEAIAKDLELNHRPLANGASAPHFSEHVRRLIVEEHGEKALYHKGLQVFTTLDAKMQSAADAAVYRGLRAYDRRHGYRGPIGRINLINNWQNRIKETAKNWPHKKFGEPAAVLEITKTTATVGLANNRTVTIPLDLVKWARKYVDDIERGPRIKAVTDVLAVGDIVVVRPLTELADYREGGFKKLRTREDRADLYSLEQIPTVQAALVAIDTKTGAVRALVGGHDAGTGFNRVTQAKRQPGSAFKPLVYALALMRGQTPASIVLDAPVVLPRGETGTWKPQNYSTVIYGPSPLRRGLEKSRNLMTIRLAQKVGIRNIVGHAQTYGITSELAPNLSTALGSSALTPLEMTNAYRVFPNGGYYSEPYFVDTIQTVHGETIEAFPSQCHECTRGFTTRSAPPPLITPLKQQVLSPAASYQMVSMLEGVVQRGTGWRAKALGRPLGGKTGTTNDYKDAWFVGFSPDLVVGVWVGFDNPRQMGKDETGSKAAAPIWVWFLEKALKGKPIQNFDVPDDIHFVRIDRDTGTRPTPNTKNTLLEAFAPGTGPNTKSASNYQNTGSTEPNTPQEPQFNLEGIY
jgi:penicillin-binding protein 1A